MLMKGLDEARLAEFAKNVELTATRVLEGWHKSRRSGGGIEFHSSLPYSEGEDVRRLDWKRYAATDRLYIKRFEQSRKAHWNYWLDHSESMDFGNKAAYAQVFVAALIFLSRTWGDSWRLLGEDGQDVEKAFQSLLTKKKGFDVADFLNLEVKNSYIVLVSDFFFDLNKIKAWIKSRAEQSNKLILTQVLDLEELTFSFNDVMQFEDMESASKMTLDSRAVRSRYFEELLKHKEELKKLTKAENCFFFSFAADLEKLPDHLLEVFDSL